MSKKKPPEADVEPSEVDPSSALAILKEAKEKALADNLDVQNNIATGNLVPRDLVANTLGHIFATYRRQFLVISDSSGTVVSYTLGVKDTASILSIVKIISDVSYWVMSDLKKAMLAYIESLPVGPGVIA